MVRVAVIGAGTCGLAATKSCKEEDIDVVCYEKSGRLTGLWSYHDDDTDGEACTMKSTVINSSKEITALSDFPPPKDFPNYMHNTMMHKYFTMYAETFGLMHLIRNYHEVVQVVPASDYDETGRWVVTVKNTKTDEVIEEVFDGVMVCTGHHGYPYSPKFPGQEDFKGKVMHTHSLKVPDAFKNQRVIIIGLGNSGIDAAVEISNVAKQVYLSTRRGTWLYPRLGLYGMPFDTQLLSRFWDDMGKFWGHRLKSAFVEFVLNLKFDHAIYNLRPKHRWDATHLTINDVLPNKINSGSVILKDDVETFTEKGIIFQGEESSTKADSIILATGYRIKFPFLSEKIVDTSGNQVTLFKYMFPPDLKHHTLAIVGLIQPFGPLFPVFEAQSRWFAMLMNKKIQLPSKEDMWKDIAKKKKEVAKRYVGSPRHTVQVDYIRFMDEIYDMIGAKPNLLRIALTDPVLFCHIYFGPAVSYVYRLEGPHSWPGARRAILETKDRILCPFKTRTRAEPNKLLESFEFLAPATAVLIVLALVVLLLFCKVLYDSSTSPHSTDFVPNISERIMNFYAGGQ